MDRGLASYSATLNLHSLTAPLFVLAEGKHKQGSSEACSGILRQSISLASTDIWSGRKLGFTPLELNPLEDSFVHDFTIRQFSFSQSVGSDQPSGRMKNIIAKSKWASVGLARVAKADSTHLLRSRATSNFMSPDARVAGTFFANSLMLPRWARSWALTTLWDAILQLLESFFRKVLGAQVKVESRQNRTI